MNKRITTEQILGMAKDLPYLDDEIYNLILVFAQDESNQYLGREIIESIREFWATQKMVNKFNPSAFKLPRESEVEGDIIIGRVTGTNAPYGVSKFLLSMGILLLGQPNAGKTSLLYLLFTGVHGIKNMRILVFSMKQEYRILLDRCDNILIFRWEDFRHNPLVAPPKVATTSWINTIAEIFSNECGGLIFSKGFLVKALQELFKIYGTNDYPSLFDLLEYLEQKNIPRSSKDFNYSQTVISLLSALLTSSGNLFNCSKGYDLTKLLEHNVVIECDQLLIEHARFFVNSLLFFIFHYKMSNR